MKNHDRMKAADTYYSIHLYTFIASYKNFRSKKRIGTATNTYTRELLGKLHDLRRLTIFRTFSIFCHFITSDARIMIQHLLKANIMSFLELYSKRTMHNEIYDVQFLKQTKTLD